MTTHLTDNHLQTLPVHLHIGEEKRPSGTAPMHQHCYPVTGETNGEVPVGGPAEIEAAVAAAEAALPGWARTTPATRRDLLVRLGHLVTESIDDFARLAVLDTGMPYRMGQITATILRDWILYYAGWADKLEGAVVSTPASGGDLAYTVNEPYGVVGVITTWNGSLVSLGMKVIPALAAGNTVVLKPSELAPFANEKFMSLIEQAGFPPGVLNSVIGDRVAGQALIRHKAVQKISFTGGPATARAILAECAAGLKPAVLELGGKSASLIYPDVNLDAALGASVFTTLKTLTGQGCSFPTRLLVHADIYDEAVAKLLDQVAAVKIGDPFDDATDSGPVVTEQARQRILGMIDRARSEKAGELLAGGGVPQEVPAGGFYIEPTVFGDVDPSAEISQTEIFGPVITVSRFSSDDEAVSLANSTDYGLAAYVWSNDLTRVRDLSGRLETGGVYINGASTTNSPELPFGGIGLSGFGREGGREGIFEYLRTKSVAIGGYA